jgi:hypothetical protein
MLLSIFSILWILCISHSKIGLSSPPHDSTYPLSFAHLHDGGENGAGRRRPKPRARRSNGERGEELTGFVLSVDEELAEQAGIPSAGKIMASCSWPDSRKFLFAQRISASLLSCQDP